MKIFSFPLFLLIWYDFYLYLSIHLCFEGMRRFQINLQGLYMQSEARPIESSQLTSNQAWIQEKTNPIKFKSNWSKEIKGNLHQIQFQFGLGFQPAHQLVVLA